MSGKCSQTDDLLVFELISWIHPSFRPQDLGMARVLCAELGHKSFNQMTWAVLEFQSMQHAIACLHEVAKGVKCNYRGHFNLSCDDM